MSRYGSLCKPMMPSALHYQNQFSNFSLGYLKYIQHIVILRMMSTHVYPITGTILAPAGVEKKRARMFLSWGKRGELNRVVMELAGWLGLLLFEIQQSLHINEERVVNVEENVIAAGRRERVDIEAR